MSTQIPLKRAPPICKVGEDGQSEARSPLASARADRALTITLPVPYSSPMVAVLLVLFAVAVVAAALRPSWLRSMLVDLGALGVTANPSRLSPARGDVRLRSGLLTGP